MRASQPYAPPVDDILHALRVVTGGTADLVSMEEPIRAFARFAAAAIAPTDAIGDEEGASLADGSVTVPAELVKAHREFVEGGWAAAAHPTAIGGGGLGRLFGTVLQEIYSSANLALSLNAVLTQGAVDLLAEWAEPHVRQKYLPPLVSGEWSGTMNLTEPDAGSDVGALRTTARPGPDGTWSVTGTKVFITWGEHDMGDNIVHLVLARTPGAPPGVKGISLFAVPKILDGGRRNAVRCTGLERKLGIHASPTCVLEFADATGDLVGPLHGGMAAMFTMMNAARLAIGVQGGAIAERSWQQALGYALERRQGRRSGTGPVVIAEHPDVRRMLADLRSTSRAVRLVLYATAHAADRHREASSGADRASSKGRLDLLTPIAKAWAADQGVRAASEALQVHGGSGFVEDTGIAQRYRDARIVPIYEGTNGIHAIDLAVRKVAGDGGTALRTLLEELERDVAGWPLHMAGAREAVDEALHLVGRLAGWVVRTHPTSPDSVLAGATPFLDLVGTTVAAAMLGRSVACDVARPVDEHREDLEFFVGHRLVPALGLHSAVTSGAERLPEFV